MSVYKMSDWPGQKSISLQQVYYLKGCSNVIDFLK